MVDTKFLKPYSGTFNVLRGGNANTKPMVFSYTANVYNDMSDGDVANCDIPRR